MGYYIDRTPAGNLPSIGKARFLLDNVEGAKVIAAPKKWEPDLVCVVENGFFDAAAYAFNRQEMIEFSDPNDRRYKTWMIVPDAAKLSGYEHKEVSMQR